MFLRYAIRIELKIRFFLICFSTFSFLYIMVDEIFSKYIYFVNTDNVFILAILIVLAFLIALFIKLELLEFFKKDWEWKPKNFIQKAQNEFFCIVGIGCLYYFSQVGAMIIFFPSFEEIAIHSYKLYNTLFIFSSVVIYIIYRSTILKFK
ncbi:hypothetical protein AAGG74_16965 [Bacillus mexicanus]|uniref:hypothetical protein n=1 Tax=Bacillus mexicanus TaxID=2834415 RepID=UPI003D19669B